MYTRVWDNNRDLPVNVTETDRSVIPGTSQGVSCSAPTVHFVTLALGFWISNALWASRLINVRPTLHYDLSVLGNVLMVQKQCPV